MIENPHGEDFERPLSLSVSVNERARLESARRFRVLEIPANGTFDHITSLAAEVFGVPIALVTVVDEDRIWFKSRFGLSEVTSIPREPGLCSSVICQDEAYVVDDARSDPRTLANSLVAGDFGLQFYAGAPLITTDGKALGTLCIIDREPRTFSGSQRKILELLASIVVRELELRLATVDTVDSERRQRLASSARTRELAELYESDREAIHALQASEERFRTLAASMPHVILETDASGAVTFLSEVYASYTGFVPEYGNVDFWGPICHPDELAVVRERWQAALSSGKPFREELRIRRHDGSYRWHEGHIRPQRDLHDRLVRWTGTLSEVHDARRAALESRFLAEAGRLLAESLDVKSSLQKIARLTVPEFADWCQIDLRTVDDKIQTVALAHSDAQKHQLGQQLVGRIHLNPDASSGNPYAIRTGCSDLISDVPTILDDAVGDNLEVELYRRLGVRSAACVPLVAQGVTLGAIAVVYGNDRRMYSRDDLLMLEELGRRAGVAIQNAARVERDRRTAQSFQEASLPHSLPAVSGLAFDAIYVPGSDEAQVGGDWYDAMELDDGRVVISIGDVAGHGLAAAVKMGNIRQIIRGIAQVHANPSLILDAADRALRLEYPDHYVTAFVGVLDPESGKFTYASAGHPPVLLRMPGGEIELLSDFGLPLGIRPKADGPREETVVIPGGSQLVLYTDGITEHAHDLIEGERELDSIVRGKTLFQERNPARTLLDAVLKGKIPKDDVAILIVNIDRHRSP